jgi:hypothetical protein
MKTPPPVAAPEPVWPGVLATVMAASLQIFLPESLSAGPGWLPAVAVAISSSIHFVLPGDRYHGLHRVCGHISLAIATAALSYSLYQLIVDLLMHRMASGSDFLRSALLLWSMNVIVFSSWYWFLDSGGPRMRSSRKRHIDGAFLFPQMTLPDQFPDFRPGYIDYLFLSFNTATAFSPTDSPVLSRWAKALMMIESSISLSTLAIVAARAVNIL